MNDDNDVRGLTIKSIDCETCGVLRGKKVSFCCYLCGAQDSDIFRDDDGDKFRQCRILCEIIHISISPSLDRPLHREPLARYAVCTECAKKPLKIAFADAAATA